MGRAAREGLNHDVEIPQTSRDDWIGSICGGPILLATEVVRAIRIIWRSMETMVGLPKALEIPVCDYVQL
jgi:hypothetical protein